MKTLCAFIIAPCQAETLCCRVTTVTTGYAIADGGLFDGVPAIPSDAVKCDPVAACHFNLIEC